MMTTDSGEIKDDIKKIESTTMAKNQQQTEKSVVRLDKWLWAARFFKTRSLASEAIRAGHVQVDGARVKVSKAAAVGQLLRIQKDWQVFEVVIKALSSERKGAPLASQLYEETAASIKAREETVLLRRLSAQTTPNFKGRPTKRDRRQIVRFHDQSYHDEE